MYIHMCTQICSPVGTARRPGANAQPRTGSTWTG